MSQNIHATCVSINSKGVMFLGDSGAGKSDMALRLITMFSAKLVCDDRAEIYVDSDRIKAKAPERLAGMMEVRGVGLVNIDYLKETNIDLVISLTTDKIERMPEKKYYEINGIKIPMFELNPFEVSSASKVVLMLSLL